MSFTNWLRNMKAAYGRPKVKLPRVRGPRLQPPLRARLRIEALEDRLVPSTFTVTSTNDDGPG